MFKAFAKLEFSKKMAIIVLLVYAIFMFGVVILRTFFNESVPAVELLNATIAIPLVEIAAFSTKAGFENVQKIVQNKVETIIGKEETKTSDTI